MQPDLIQVDPTLSSNMESLSKPLIAVSEKKDAAELEDPDYMGFLREFLFGKSFGAKVCDGLKGIVTRKPSALYPLDGLRAIAIIWVFALHSTIYNTNEQNGLGRLSNCFKTVPVINVFYYFAKSGDLGVDIFFVLSGFLIGFILLKEYKKYGNKIDVWAFYRGRFFRLWPLVFVWIFTRTIVEGILFNWTDTPNAFNWKNLSVLFFTNNWIGAGDQGWSLAVEFQFYLASPLFIYWMGRSKGS